MGLSLYNDAKKSHLTHSALSFPQDHASPDWVNMGNEHKCFPRRVVGISWGEGGDRRFKLPRELQCAVCHSQNALAAQSASPKSQVRCHVSVVLVVAESLFPSIHGCLHSSTMLLWLIWFWDLSQCSHQSLLRGH